MARAWQIRLVLDTWPKGEDDMTVTTTSKLIAQGSGGAVEILGAQDAWMEALAAARAAVRNLEAGLQATQGEREEW